MSRKNSQNRIWTDAETSILITLVEQKPAIWQKTSQAKKNSYQTSKNWDEISESLGIPKKVVQDKWKSLFRRMRSEVAKSPPEFSGAEASEYKSDWQFFEQLRFVLGSILWGESTGNLTDLLAKEEKSDCEMSAGKRSCTQELMNIEGKKVSLLESIEKSIEKENITDDDLLFVKTLLPYIQKIPDEKRLLFREEISQLVRKYLLDDDCVIIESGCTRPKRRLMKIKQETIVKQEKVQIIKKEKPVIVDLDIEQVDGQTGEQSLSQMKNNLQINNNQPLPATSTTAQLPILPQLNYPQGNQYFPGYPPNHQYQFHHPPQYLQQPSAAYSYQFPVVTQDPGQGYNCTRTSEQLETNTQDKSEPLTYQQL